MLYLGMSKHGNSCTRTPNWETDVFRGFPLSEKLQPWSPGLGSITLSCVEQLKILVVYCIALVIVAKRTEKGQKDGLYFERTHLKLGLTKVFGSLKSSCVSSFSKCNFNSLEVHPVFGQTRIHLF